MSISVKGRLSRAAAYLPLLALWAFGLWRLGQASLWYDEVFNADLALGHTVGQLLHVLRTQQPYPPLYPLVLKGWAAVLAVRPYAPGLEPAGGLEELLRLPSVAAAVAALAALAGLVRRLRLRGALAVPLLLCLHPTVLWYARDVRLYSTLVLWFLLALLGLVTRRKYLWGIAAAGASLTHYFAVLPLVGAVLGAVLFGRPRWRLPVLLLPFVPLTLWAVWAIPVTLGFESFALASPPSFGLFLEELGPSLLFARGFLQPLPGEPTQACWGYVLLVLGIVGLFLLALKDRARGGIAALSFGLGALGVFAVWQVRPVHHVRYLVWALPLLTIGIVSVVTALPGRAGGARVAVVLLGALSVLGALWGGTSSRALMAADRNLWYPDFRGTIAFLNTQARDGDRGLSVAGHASQTFTVYRSPVPFVSGPQIGERLRPEEAARLLQAVRPRAAGRWWLLLFQDGAVDPGQVLVGTMEAAGGYRPEMWYNRELRLFAYALPDGAALRPLVPQTVLDVSFEGGIRLRGFSVHREERLLGVYLFWELSAPQTEPLIGTVHLARRAGERPAVQQDKPVLNAYWPLPRLPVGEVVPDRYELVLPPDLAPGTYELLAALYDPQTGERRPLPDGADMVDLRELSLP